MCVNSIRKSLTENKCILPHSIQTYVMCNVLCRTAAVMDDIDVEQQEPFPVDRDGRRIRMEEEDELDGNRKLGCCEKFQRLVSKWMLPEDHRKGYMERANCCPPPIFIILISIGEVRL